MKSFVAYPSGLEKAFFPQISPRNTCGNPIAHVELYKKVYSLNGCIVKCGIAAEEGFTRFMALKTMLNPLRDQPMIAFEKFSDNDVQKNKSALYCKINNAAVSIDDYQQAMVQKGKIENVTFIPGHVDDSIAHYLIENPELKISYLDIDLNDYNMTTTCLEFFYPRLVLGGVIVFDNYYKHEEDYMAINDYFAGQPISIHKFPGQEGPHYIFRK